MDKITQLKDINGNLVYPKILSESIPDKAINKTQLNSDVTSIFDGLISREFQSRSGESAQNAFETGIYPWCTSGGPGDISGAFTLIVLRTKDADSNGFYSIYQTAIAREDVPNNYEHRVYSRLILRNDSSNVTTYTKWIEISSRQVRDSLNTEVQRAQAAEKKNKDAIAVLNGDSNTAGSVKKAIADLIGGAPEAYDTLKEIADYIASDKNAGAALTKAISNETIRAKAAEGTNTTAINNEVSRAKGAEKTLTDSVNTEVTRAKAAEKQNADAIVAINNILSNRLTYKEV